MKIKYETSGGCLTTFEQGDWGDLSTAESVKLEAGAFKAVSLGIRMQLPKGFEAILALRSSTGKRYKILMYNAPGVIDESFNGPKDIWHALVYAPEGAVIPIGARIAQFRIQPKMNASFWTKLKWLFTSKVEFIKAELPQDMQSRGGLGSTN